jgi:MFS transporter, DHA2 family, multidrug resistance protein
MSLDGGRIAGPVLERSAAGNRNPWLIAVVVSLATFMQVLDTSIANVALRNIAGSLAASADESTWVITSYLVASAVILPISGWLSNVIGRKRFYMLCVATFSVFSVLCGLAQSLPMLIVFRVLQGLGGGGMAPSEQAILADTFTPRQRGQAFALYGIAVIVAPTVGPTLGGWITDNSSWHWIFFINAPIGVISLLLVQWLVTEPEILKRERRALWAGGLRIDWLGFALAAVALGCLEIVLDKGQREDWFQSNFIILFSVVAIVSLVLFIPWELTRKDPIVEIRLLGHRQFGTSFIMMMSVGAVLFSSTQLIPQLLQTNFAYTAMLSGLALMPGGLAMLLMMPIAGQVTGYVQPKYLMAFGMFVVALSMWHLTSLTPTAGFDFFSWARVYQTIGLPFLFIPITSASYADVPPNQTNQASALINVARNLGGSIGVSAATTMLAQRAQFHQERLTENLVPSSSQYQGTVSAMTNYFVSHGFSRPDAQQHAMGLIEQAVQAQSTLMSYIDVFWGYAFVALLMTLPALFLLHQIDLRGGSPGAAAH